MVFKNWNFLTVGKVQRVNMRHCARIVVIGQIFPEIIDVIIAFLTFFILLTFFLFLTAKIIQIMFPDGNVLTIKDNGTVFNE